MKLPSRFNVNGIALIAMPRKGESGVPRRIHEHVAGLATLHGFPFASYFPENAEQLADALKDLFMRAEEGMRPILQIDCHGSKKRGLEIGGSGEYIGWSMLAEFLRAINVMTDNNLVVILSACHAFEAIRVFPITQHVPYYSLYAPEGLISEGEIEACIYKYYNALVETQSFDLMHAAMEASFRLFHCERVFMLSFARYIKENCRGKGRASRIERLLTEALAVSNSPNTPENRKKYRKTIKLKLPPTQETVEKFAATFLGAREFCGTLADIQTFLK